MGFRCAVCRDTYASVEHFASLESGMRVKHGGDGRNICELALREAPVWARASCLAYKEDGSVPGT